MRALPRGAAASLLRAAAAAAPCRPRPVQLQRRLPDADRLLAMVRVLPPSPHPLHSSSDPSCVGCPILCGILIAVCLQRGKPSTEPAIAMRDRSPPGQQHHHDTNTLKRRPHEGCDAERRCRHPSKELDKVFTQSSLPREEGYFNSALRRVTTPEGEVTAGPKKLG
uniref:Uncharacterized protein n=1 Tax=Oryza rufipogon TaxID=4529 RepID=A0A0E0RHF0_ORYRU